MSVIGPRPGLWNQDILTAERDKYNANDVKPGLTGWAQINGRDELEIPEKAKLDGEYVSKMGLMMDIKCFLGSVGVFAHDDSVVEGGTGEMKKVGRHYTDGKSAEELIGHIGFGETVEVDTETKKRVLITGAGSYIGETFKAYAEEYYPALEIDAVDMLDPAWREKDFSEYDIIYHVAGIAHADVGNVDDATKEKYYAVNTDLAVEVCEKAKREGAKEFIFMSSMIVYGDSAPYTLSADKKTALSLDFSRLHRLRPGYGYANLLDETEKEKCPDKTCIWKIDIQSGEITPVLKYTDFISFETRPEMKDAEHKVNHLMLAPNGKRFMVLHRWFKDGKKYTRLVTCNVDGTDMFNLSDDDFVSHCCWKNDNEILSYLNKKDGGKGYYLMRDKSLEYVRMWPSLMMDGHPTYSYDGRYVVTDTYPNRKRIQSLYVMKDDKINNVAKVFSPFRFGGDVRCDLHPRWSKDGKQICFDASFEGKRGVYVVDTSKLYDSSTIMQDENNEKPKVSIIIPCYNCADFIDETLECLVAQTYKNFEVVCINDGSKDTTLEHLEKWENSGKLKISIINQENAGVSRARNNGIKKAAGEYILFLDSDDRYHEKFVEFMVINMEKNNTDMGTKRC